MYPAVATVVIVAAVALAAWCAVPVWRDRWTSPAQRAGLVALEISLLVQAVLVLVRVLGGERPAQPLTFTGYLVTSLLVLPAAAVLSSMERTRWGSVIVAGAALVVAVLVLRLRQTWQLPG